MPRVFRCDLIGDGSENAPFTPAIALYADVWMSRGDERADETQKTGTMLVEVPDKAILDPKYASDTRIVETPTTEQAVKAAVVK